MKNHVVENVWLKNSIKAPGFLPLSYQVLINRGLKGDEVNEFLSLDNLSFHDPFILQDMKKAVDLILEKMEKVKRIMIYGDYDVDGVTSIALLYHFFKMIGFEISYFIPDREQDGYGLNGEILKELSKEFDLLITVDCGITAVEEVQWLKDNGKSIIITDHHQRGETLPEADAIINPHLEEEYPTEFLAGVGVALKLAQAIATNYKITNQQWSLLYSLAALGTVADIVPLQKENRLITKLGIKALNQTSSSYGIEALKKVSNIKEGEVDTGNIAFGIAPRINASGRLGDALDALTLLITDNQEEAFSLAEKLNLQNEKRKAIEHKILSQALKMIDRKDNIHILYSEDWHQGVLGIVASKIVEITYKPAILIAGGKACLKGSGRSIKGIHLQKILLELDNLLISHGGHELAAGLSLEKDKLNEFKAAIKQRVDEMFDQKEFLPQIRVDVVEDVSNLNYDTACELESLGPFGYGNPKPNILLESVEIIDIQSISKGKHLKLVVKDFFEGLECLKWNTSEIDYNIGDKIDILGTASKNEWMNIKSASLIIKDIKENPLFRIIDKRKQGDKTNVLETLEKEEFVVAYYNKDKSFDDAFNFENFYEPIFFNKDKKQISFRDTKSLVEAKNIILYDMPFFANQLNRLPVSRNGKVIVLYNKQDYSELKETLSKLIIDRNYLLEVYKKIISNQIEIDLQKSLEKSMHDRIEAQKFSISVKVFNELGLIDFVMDNTNKLLIQSRNSKKVDISNSTILVNHNKTIERSKSDAKFLYNADEKQLNKYIRRP